ncbi:MAG: aminotransferase class I/II-fold pyridoxal phosphate-dependent enzyme [Chloroflexi bacterium]|uniref:homocysteine desulfhydrase n=1 Tax=Candidatus Chlorohelix allophototropha TaxID=3003348 RepID=A0A8T7LUL0_9CHLR|nr:aminotransferase class I/II-fold pyridoxal phosphate-dependent enzyme [Chloroflexota bacterium]WJW66438.1 aminotransferase class I/II-fold pyridoxal phosphate-dependent enzyme [Chloroflexota bacterium L227-S17]
MLQRKRAKRSQETLAAHAGEIEITQAGRPLAMPLYQTTVWGFDSVEDANSIYHDPSKGWVYYRSSGPNQSAFEKAFAQMEGAEASRATGSGMAAIFTALITAAQAGDHIIAEKSIYGVTVSLFLKQLSRFGIEVTFADLSDEQAVKAALKPNTKAIFFETLGNPLVGVADLAALANLARENKLVSIVDSTFTPPTLLRPLEYGVDVVVHATTKYTNGHSDALGGILSGNKNFVKMATESAQLIGLTMSPFDAWMNVRSLKTLPLRMGAHCRNALAIAQWLEAQPQVSRVHYPGLESHARHELAQRQLPKGFGGMLAFEIKEGGAEEVQRFIKALEHIPYVPSLADVITTVNYPAMTSHRHLSLEQRNAVGVTDRLVRISAGIEDPADIIADLEQALSVL